MTAVQRNQVSSERFVKVTVSTDRLRIRLLEFEITGQ